MRFLFLSSLIFAGLLLSMSTASAQAVADFNWSPNPPCAGQPLQFMDQSTGFILPFDWNYSFGDGNSSYGVQNPVHTYANPGTYTVWYCLLDSATWDSACVSKTITVVAGPCTTPDTVSGFVYFDVNANGSFDSGDFPLANMKVDVGGFQVTTDRLGNYSAPFNAGNYSVSIPSPGVYTVSTPTGGTHSLTLPGNGSSFTADFGLTTTSSVQDLAITIGSGRFRPGFTSPGWLVYTNKGTSAMSGSIVLTYDDSLLYVSSNPAGNHNPVARQLGFSFANLLPSQSGLVRFDFTTPASVPLGTPITMNASISPLAGDATPHDNSVLRVDTVRGSYDPNDKQVSPGYGPDGWVVPEQRLEYQIRFQNTGTDTAFTVVVVDTLPADLDLSTFDLRGASHPYTFVLDAPNRVATWTFANILLPDSNTNEPLSHGFIRFDVNPTPALPDFTTIQNKAEIYFDFNAPIVTNTTLTTIYRATSIFGGEDFKDLNVFPNPAKDRVWVRYDNQNGQLHQLELRDVQGRMVLQAQSRGHELELPVKDLTPGLYLYRLKADDGRSATGKLILK